MKKIIALVMALCMVFALAACGSSNTAAPAANTAPAAVAAPAAEAPAAEAPAGLPEGCPVVTSTDKVDIIWSHNANEATVGNKAALLFAEHMNQYSNGNINVTVYPNGELGSVPENDQAVKEGTVQIVSGTTGGAADPKLSYFDTPMMVNSQDEAYAMMQPDTELYAYTQGVYNSLGLQMLGIVPAGFRETSSNKAVRSYEDLKGLNIRTMEVPAHIAYWKAWGCNPTPVAWGETYLALQQGLVDAQENAYETIYAAKLNEVQKYIINTNHIVMWSGMYMNLDFYNNLPDDYRELLNWVVANEIMPYLYEEQAVANDAALQAMVDQGIEVIDLSAEDYAKMRENAAPAIELITQAAGQEAMDILAAAQAAAAAA